MEHDNQSISSTGESLSATLEKLNGLEDNDNESESSEISDEQTDFSIQKWKAKNELKRKQAQAKECTTSTTDILPMKSIISRIIKSKTSYMVKSIWQ